MGFRDLVYRLYERRLESSLSGLSIPRHVGVILRRQPPLGPVGGLPDVSNGHQTGADKIFELLGWCREAGVEVVTLWLLSTDNLDPARPPSSSRCCGSSRSTVRDLAAQGWHVKPVGALDLLPGGDGAGAQGRRRGHRGQPGAAGQRRGRLRRPAGDRRRGPLAAAGARHQGHVTIEELAEILDVEHIAEHLYTAGQPDPDLVIRTSGEQRLGGFLLWQSAHSEFYFCDAYWPDFRQVDFLRALRSYAARHRRFGS